MHKQGSSSWFGDGWEERQTILKVGEPWKGKHVLEVGCGEGELCGLMATGGAKTVGIDYSHEAIEKASEIRPDLIFVEGDYRQWKAKQVDVLVMQGVLEHLDSPFIELQWMIEHFKPKTVITSSPCFLNPRGIVWMTLDMLGAVMSKTDLHYLHRWEFEDFCNEHKYKLTMETCDWSWGNDMDMQNDLRKRIPLALKDGNLPCNIEKVEKLLYFLWDSGLHCDLGATVVYRIDL